MCSPSLFQRFIRRILPKLLGVLASWLLLFVCLSIFAPISYAGSDKASSDGTPIDQLCVEGSVINHDETPLGAGWIINAFKRGSNGDLMNDSFIELLTDSNGYFGKTDSEGNPVIWTPGTWYLAIQLKENWEPVTGNFDIELAYGRTDCVKVRFKLRRLVTVNVLKINDQHEPLPGWIINAQPGSDNRFATAQSAVTGKNGIAVFRLTQGVWIFSEAAPSDVESKPIMPADGTQELNVVAPGPYTLRFKNDVSYQGCVEVYKYDSPPAHQQRFPLPEWRIELRRMDGSIASFGLTDVFGEVKFLDVPPGPYLVLEERRVGWKPAAPSGYEVQVVGSKHCAKVYFYNEQARPQFCIEGRKIDANGKVGLPGWKISAESLNLGGYQPAPVYTDGEGYYKFVFPEDDYRIPGAMYRIREEMQPGWEADNTPTSYEVILPQERGACVQVGDFQNRQIGHPATPASAQSEQAPTEQALAEQAPAEQAPTTITGCRLEHVANEGDGVMILAVQYGVSYRALLRANPWVQERPNQSLTAGDKVCIPYN